MAKRIRTKRIKFDRRPISAPIRPVLSDPKYNTKHGAIKLTADLQSYNNAYDTYKYNLRRQRTSNAFFASKLVFRCVIIVLSLGLIFYMFGNSEFVASEVIPRIISGDYAPWDFNTFVNTLHTALPRNPILDTISGGVIFISSAAYVLAFGVNLLFAIFGLL